MFMTKKRRRFTISVEEIQIIQIVKRIFFSHKYHSFAHGTTTRGDTFTSRPAPSLNVAEAKEV